MHGGRLGDWKKIMSLWKDLRTAARGLARRPGFTLTAATTLALGIGATVAIFTVVNSVLIQPLPYPNSERIVFVNHHAPGLDFPDVGNSPGTLRLYREFATVFGALGAFNDRERNLQISDQPDRVRIVEVTPSIFAVLQVQPRIGRAFVEEDAAAEAAPVVILTDATWRGRFGSDPAVLGRTVQLDGITTEIVGVTPGGFAFPDPEPVALTPLHVDADGPFAAFAMTGLARLGAGVTLEAARQQVRDLQGRLSDDPGVPAGFLERAGWSASLTPMRDALVEDVQAALWILLGTVGFVFLIVCGNVANLFLVRAESRRKEMAIRRLSARGAGAWRRPFFPKPACSACSGAYWALRWRAGACVRSSPTGPACSPASTTCRSTAQLSRSRPAFRSQPDSSSAPFPWSAISVDPRVTWREMEPTAASRRAGGTERAASSWRASLR